MEKLYITRKIKLEWSITKWKSQAMEDFSRADSMAVFLIGNNNRWPLAYEINSYGVILIDELPTGLSEGAYSIECIWLKNLSRLEPRKFPAEWFLSSSAIHARRDYLFYLTTIKAEDIHEPGDITLKFKTPACIYGYDGLSAYELAVLRGDFEGSLDEYIKLYTDSIEKVQTLLAQQDFKFNELMEDLQDFKEEKETEIDGLEQDLQEFKQEKSTEINASLAEMAAAKSNVQETIAAAEQTVDDLEFEVNSLVATASSEIQVTVSQANQKIGTLSEEITEVKDTMVADMTKAISDSHSATAAANNAATESLAQYTLQLQNIYNQVATFLGTQNTRYYGILTSLPEASEKYAEWCLVGQELTALISYISPYGSSTWRRFGQNTYNFASGSGTPLISSTDTTAPSNSSAYSSLRTFIQFLNKKADDIMEGMLTIRGKLIANAKSELQDTEVYGTLSAKKDTRLRETTVTGTLNVSDKSTLQATDIKGTLDVAGKSDLHATDITGKLDVNGNMRTSGKLTFRSSIENEDFHKNVRGIGIYKDEDENWHLETDFLDVRKKLTAEAVEIHDVYHVKGAVALTAANAKVAYVIEFANYFRCYFLKRGLDGTEITNDWLEGDLAYCKTFNLVKRDGKTGNHYLWRKVIHTGYVAPEEDGRLVDEQGNFATDADGRYIYGYRLINGKWELIKTIITDDEGNDFYVSDMFYIDLSKVSGEYATNSDAPLQEDHIIQLGNLNETSRQGAIILSSSGSGAPYEYMFKGIKSFTLPAPKIEISPSNTKITANEIHLVVEGEDKDISDVIEDKAEEIAEEVGAGVKSQIDEEIAELEEKAYQAEAEAEEAKAKALQAESAAATAKQAADVSSAQLGKMASDSIITLQEKMSLQSIWNNVVATHTQLDTQADKYSVARTAYDTAYTALSALMSTILASTTDYTIKQEDQYNTKWANYYTEESSLYSSIATKAKQLADAAQAAADEAKDKVEEYKSQLDAEIAELEEKASQAEAVAAAAATKALQAESAAATAKQAADVSSAQLSKMASDSVITLQEKMSLQSIWNNVVATHTQLDTQADKYGVNRFVYDNAYSSLSTLMSTILASTTDYTIKEDDQYSTKWANYYTEESSLYSSIATKAKQLADAAQAAANEARAAANEAQAAADEAQEKANQVATDLDTTKRELKSTGIDIEAKKITVTADKFIVQGNHQEQIATFVATEDGVFVNADCIRANLIDASKIDASKIKAENLDSSKITSSSMVIKYATGITKMAIDGKDSQSGMTYYYPSGNIMRREEFKYDNSGNICAVVTRYYNDDDGNTFRWEINENGVRESLDHWYTAKKYYSTIAPSAMLVQMHLSDMGDVNEAIFSTFSSTSGSSYSSYNNHVALGNYGSELPTAVSSWFTGYIWYPEDAAPMFGGSDGYWYQVAHYVNGAYESVEYVKVPNS